MTSREPARRDVVQAEEAHADDRNAFKPLGVSREQALAYLRTEEGQRYLTHVRRGAPSFDDGIIARMAIEQIQSGSTLPVARTIDQPLVKIVPVGGEVASYSPYLTIEDELARSANAGASLADRLGLPQASSSNRYDLHMVAPRGKAEVFTSVIAPTTELNGQIRHSGGAIQVLTPDRTQFYPSVRIGTVEDRLAPGQTYRALLSADAISDGLDGPPARLRPGTALGMAGVVLSAYDAVDTGFRIKGHLDSGNATAAQSEAIHFGGRTVGGLTGVGLGIGLGAAAGIKTGPGALVTGTAGGIVGAVAGDRMAAWIDDRSIYNQTDRQGNEWTLDPARPDRGWRRAAPVDGTQDGIDNARRESLRASPLLESELNFQATRRSAELVLGSPPVPKDPFSQPAREGDTPSVVVAPWVRTAGGWERTATLAYAERGLSPTRTERASAERAAELDQAAAQTIVRNAENSAPVIAARLEDAYASQGWARFAPMPEAVRQARTHIDTLVASDGGTYTRQPDGGWVSRGMLRDSAASGNIREELDATRTLLESRLPPPRHVEPPPALTADERLRDTVVGAYRNAGIELTPAQLDARAAAVESTWRSHGLSADTTALRVSAQGGRADLDSPIESLRLEADGRTYRIAATTIAGERESVQAMGDVQTTSLQAAGFSPPARSRGEGEEEPGALRPRLANDPGHADHATFDRIHGWVRGTGHWDEEKSLNVASALYREQAENPLIRRVDHVVGGMGKDGAENVFAVYAPFGDREPRFHVHVDGRHASQQPAQQSLEQAESMVQQRSQEQSMQHEQTQQQARSGQAMVR